MSDTSVHYSTPDGSEHAVGFDRLASLKWNSSNKICWPLDKRNRRVRYRGCPVNLRVKPNLESLLDGVLHRDEFQFDCDPQQVVRHNKRTTWLMILFVYFFPGSFLAMLMFVDMPEVAENEIGQKYRVGLAILKTSLLLIVLSVTAIGLHQLRSISRCKRLKCVTHEGILAAHPDSKDVLIPYHELLMPSSTCGTYYVQTAGRQKILLPHRYLIHIAIIRVRTNFICLPKIKPTLCFAIPLILAGPAQFLWNMYLIPEEPYANELFRYFVLPIFGVATLIDPCYKRWRNAKQLKRTTTASE